jgi:hypothetical protein
MKISTNKFFLSAPFLFPFINSLVNKKKSLCLENNDDEETTPPHHQFAEDYDPELLEFNKMIEDPNIDPETKEELIREKHKAPIQPLPFSKLHGPMKVGIDEEKWNGFRLSLDWNPTQMQKMEYHFIIDKPRSFNYKLNAMTIVPCIYLFIISR